MRKISRICAVAFLSIMLLGCKNNNKAPAETTITKESGGIVMTEEEKPIRTMTTTFWNAGKADAILIKTSDNLILIDTGYNTTGKELVRYFDKNGIEQIDYLIITHFDKDHVGGADSIISNMEVDYVIQPNYISDSKQYTQYMESLEKKSIEPMKLIEPMTFAIDNIVLKLFPAKQVYLDENEENNNSIVATVVHGENTFLFTGDAEKERIEELLEWDSLEHTLLKVPYHGRYQKNTDIFFKAVKPEYAIITCSEEEMADDSVINALERLDAKVYLTCNGTIECVSNGVEITVTQ